MLSVDRQQTQNVGERGGGGGGVFDKGGVLRQSSIRSFTVSTVSVKHA